MPIPFTTREKKIQKDTIPCRDPAVSNTSTTRKEDPKRSKNTSRARHANRLLHVKEKIQKVLLHATQRSKKTPTELPNSRRQCCPCGNQAFIRPRLTRTIYCRRQTGNAETPCPVETEQKLLVKGEGILICLGGIRS